MNCLISICPTSLYFACTFEECVCWVSNSRLVVICFSAFYRCQSIIFWLPFSWKSALSVAVPLKATPFFLWVLEHFLLAELLKPMCGFHFWVHGLILKPTLATVPVSQFSRSVSDPLRPHGLQQARLPCTSPTPRASSSSCPSSRWCHPTSSSSVVPFSSCLQSSPASGSFPKRQFFLSGGQRIGASASVFPMNIQDWFL